MAVYSLIPARIGADLQQELLIVMPVYNEEANMEGVFREWIEAVEPLCSSFAFLVVNDGSKDSTQQILERLEAADPDRYIVLQKPNSGHGNSCRVGYDTAVAGSGTWVFQIDSDGQCDPQYFAALWNQREEADCVFGVRKSRDDGFARVLTSRVCRIASSILCRTDLRDPNVPYRLMRRTALEAALKYIPSGFNIHNVALTYILRKTPGLRWRYADIHFRDRQGGNNSINVARVSQWGIEMLLELARLKTPK